MENKGLLGPLKLVLSLLFQFQHSFLISSLNHVLHHSLKSIHRLIGPMFSYYA